ncbi:MAG: hypothetical protein HOO99_14690 [Hyphomicrobiaceae bacterium]|nr:hypothetical protein [Hyphomicrobiaceae bacterium]
MAIISCKECLGRVSDTAATCPHCGHAAKPVGWDRFVARRKRATPWMLGVMTMCAAAIVAIISLGP